MHPVLLHLGHIAFSTDGILVALGLLSGLQLSCSLARRLQLDPDRIWNLGLVSLLTLLLAQRLLVILANLADFIAHPFWMLGLAQIRDERYFYASALLAICAGAGYITAWRLPWLRVFDCLAPGAAVALVFVSIGNLAAGTDFGRPTTAHWGVAYTSRIAARTAGTPLGVPLIPVPLYTALLHAGLAACTLWLLMRASRAGVAAGSWLFASGLGTVLLQGFRYSSADEVLVGGIFTPAQSAAVCAVFVGATLLLRDATD